LLFCIEITVTTVDSASKALKFLGLLEDEMRTYDTPIASEINQVYFLTELINIMD